MIWTIDKGVFPLRSTGRKDVIFALVDNKKEFYKRVKIVGMGCFIPVLLVTGPLGGYVFGVFLRNSFDLNFYFPLIFIVLGFMSGIWEAARIIRAIRNIDVQ